MATPITVPFHPEWELTGMGEYPSGKTRYTFTCRNCGNSAMVRSPKRLGACLCYKPEFREAVRAAKERLRETAARDPAKRDLIAKVLGGDVRTTDAGKPRVFRKARFTIDDEESFEGWTAGDLWNGWACPFLEKAEADRLAATISANVAKTGYKESLAYDAEKDEFVHRTEDDDPDDEPDPTKGQNIATPEGPRHVYAIGAWSWVWSELGA